MLKVCAYFFFLLIYQLANGQGNYVPNSVLSKGEWFKISLNKPGIYKIDFWFLKSLGVNVAGLSSSSIRLFGNGGQMLPEKVGSTGSDDLGENALLVADGGDGIFNEQDYFLFYAAGPDEWLKDSLNRKFIHRKNIYSEASYYFITIGGNGKRIATPAMSGTASKKVISYDERYFYERDSLNLLSSGKSWFGPQFNAGASQRNSRVFPVPLTNLDITSPATLVSNCIARSVGAGSVFTIKVNETEVLHHLVDGVSSSSYDHFARTAEGAAVFYPSNPLTIKYEFSSSAFGAQGWLDWFEIFARRQLSMQEAGFLFFRDWNSVRTGDTAEFTVAGATAPTQVWEITDPLTPIKMQGVYHAGNLAFRNDCSMLREYIAFNASFLTPLPLGKIKNQDLHGMPGTPYIIISYPAFLPEANRLAAFHRQFHQLDGTVVSIEEVYNEFSSGSPDPTAIRNFMKMFYDRAGGDSSKMPKYLLLFGDASFDYKNRLKPNSNFIPAYQSAVSLDPLSTYTSDDYFGFLEEGEDVNDPAILNLLDVGIGRIPARTVKQARAYVDKVIDYKDTSSLGSWRNELTFIADDEDFNLHLEDAETVSNAAASVNPFFINNKIYLDAYQQESHAAGSRYPVVNKEIEKKMESGNLILNYNGHGGFRRLAEEVVLDGHILSEWNNQHRLPLFITATCDFAPYDNPAIHSLGEDMLLRPETGAIALMTTTRLVFAYSNRVINQQYLETALLRKPDGSYPSLGEAVQTAKNNNYQSYKDITNNRKFTLLGDPALTLNFPRYQVQTTQINNNIVTSIPDTLKALEKVTVKGIISDHTGKLLDRFNGVVHMEVYDKPATRNTLANDASSLKTGFSVQERLVFNGKSTVSNGNFSFTFVIPKDINYEAGKGRISYYAHNKKDDANGSFTGFIIAGSEQAGTDIAGPAMRGWLNDHSFKNGQTVNEAPVLLVELTDSSGINITREGIGHEIIAVLDGDARNRISLNDYFMPDKDSYQQGSLRFQLPRLTEGKHSLLVKSWDNGNHSSELMMEFRVVKDKQILGEIFNYPNPVSGSTRFCFTHKLPGERLDVTVIIFTPQGQLIKSIKKTINNGSNRSCDIEWDGVDEQGIRLNPGIYIYKLEIQAMDGTKANKSKILMVL